MFKPKKNLKLSLSRRFFFFPRLLSVRFVWQTFANDVPHGYVSFKHICNLIIGYVGGRLAWKKACLSLTVTRSLNYKKKKRKEKKWLKLNFRLKESIVIVSSRGWREGKKTSPSSPPFTLYLILSNWTYCLFRLYFFLFLSSLFHVNIVLYLHKRSSGNRYFVYVCLPKTRNLSSLLTTLQEAILLKFQNIFVKAKLQAMVNFTFSFFEPLIQKRVTHFHHHHDYLVREGHVLQSLLQNCTCPLRQAEATGCQPSMAASFRMKRPTHCRQWDVQVLVSVDIILSIT